MTGCNDIDKTTEFKPKFDQNGLITCVVSDYKTHQVLMVAYMNERALRLSLQTGEAHFWSRSRQEIWHKGATSGNTQIIKSIQIDCDQDCLLMAVEMPVRDNGHIAACHTGRKSCFYRDLALDENGDISLK